MSLHLLNTAIPVKTLTWNVNFASCIISTYEAELIFLFLALLQMEMLWRHTPLCSNKLVITTTLFVIVAQPTLPLVHSFHPKEGPFNGAVDRICGATYILRSAPRHHWASSCTRGSPEVNPSKSDDSPATAVIRPGHYSVTTWIDGNIALLPP